MLAKYLRHKVKQLYQVVTVIIEIQMGINPQDLSVGVYLKCLHNCQKHRPTTSIMKGQITLVVPYKYLSLFPLFLLL